MTVETRAARCTSSAGSRSRAVPVGHRLHCGTGAEDETITPTRRGELGADRRTGRGHAARDRQGGQVGEAQQVRVRDDGGGRVDRVRSVRRRRVDRDRREAAAGRLRRARARPSRQSATARGVASRSASASTSAASANLRLVPSSNSSGVSASGLAVDVERLRLDQQPAGVDRLFPPVDLDRRQVRATLREHGGDRFGQRRRCPGRIAR